MESYAAEAVTLAHTLDVELDYSEGSLERLEALLAQLHRDRPTPAPGQNVPEPLDPVMKQTDEMARVWGGYLGEVIRRHIGGEWTVHDYPGTQSPVLALEINGSRIFPAMKIFRRLTIGDSENVAAFYRMLRDKLGINLRVQ